MGFLVLDTSVLFDLERADLLESAFTMGSTFIVPDLLYDNELSGELGTSLLTLGLRVEDLHSHEVASAQLLNQSNEKLTMVDCFALVLAQRQDYRLLTGDGPLRTRAHQDRVLCSGLFWLVDQMFASGVVGAALIRDGLVQLKAHPRCRLPKEELNSVIARWSAEANKPLQAREPSAP